MKHKTPISRQSGFTLVELVMVLVLVGVLSYGASSLFSSRDAFSSFVAKDQFISQALLAQQIALGGQATGDDPVRLVISVDSDEWIFTLTKPFDPATTADDQVLERRQESTGGSLVIDGTTINSGSSQTFTWNNEGSLVDGNNHNILFDGETSYRVCLSASGFAYSVPGACP